MADLSGVDTSYIDQVNGFFTSQGDARTLSAGVIALDVITGTLPSLMNNEGSGATSGRLQLWGQTSTTSHEFVEVVANQYNQFWGRKSDGTLWRYHLANSFSSYGTQSSWTQFGTDTDWESLGAGQYHTMAIKNGAMYAMGYNPYGMYGSGSTSYYTSFTQIGSDTDWAIVDCGQYTSIAAKTNGDLYAAGRNSSYGTGLGTSSGNTTTWTQVSNVSNVIAISCGPSQYLVIEEATAGDGHGAVYGAGYNNANSLGISGGTKTTPTISSITTLATSVGCGFTRCLAVEDGNLHTAGYSTGNIYWIDSGSHTSGWEFDVGTDFQYVQMDGAKANQNVGLMKKGNKHYMFSNSLNGYVLNGQTGGDNGNDIDAIEDWSCWSDAGLTVDSVVKSKGYAQTFFITVS